MENIKGFYNYIKEYKDLSNDKSFGDKFSDVSSDIKEMIEKSLESSDFKNIKEFISSYIKTPEDTKIEGLISDSDVYEFYLKYRNDIDELLSEIKFYDNPPSEIGSFSLYDYIIKGTNKFILEIISSM